MYINLKIAFVLVILSSSWSTTGILIQREDDILEQTFLVQRVKRLKISIGKVYELILKGKMRLQQIVRTDPAEIVVPFINAEMASLWAQDEHWQRACSNFLGENNNK